MFYGDPELYFTPQEAERIARAEGLRPDRRPRPAPRARPTAPGFGYIVARAFGIAGQIFLMLLVTSVVLSILRQTAASPKPAPRTEATRKETKRMRIGHEVTRAASVPRHPTKSAHVKTYESKAKQTLDRLPPGWGLAILPEELDLHEHPDDGARVMTVLPRGATLLIRTARVADHCSEEAAPPGTDGFAWRFVVSGDGSWSGFGCLAIPHGFPTQAQRRLSAAWVQSTFRGATPANLQYSNGQIPPDAEIIRLRFGKMHDSLTISAEGLARDASQFVGATPRSD